MDIETIACWIWRAKDDGTVDVLLLKRKEERGGFWQPVVGVVEGGERIEEAVVREIEEETGLYPIAMTGELRTYTFEYEGNKVTEHVFCARVDDNAEVIIGQNIDDEHERFVWIRIGSDGEGKKKILDMLKWEENRDAFVKAVEHIIGERGEYMR